MPRGRIQLGHCVESLSILAADGTVDTALEPRIDAEDLRRLYRAMLLGRRFDEQMVRLQGEGRIGAFRSCLGQEAASLGPAYAMGKEDWLIPTFRETPAMLYRGWSMEKLILWWTGHEYGATVPEGVNDLPMCVPAASQCPHAAGIAWGLKLGGREAAAVVFVGDGGTSQGDFSEAMNCAGVLKLPLVVAVQNNQWAFSTPRARQTASTTIAQKAIAYGFDGIQVDGNDILAMIVASDEAIGRARGGEGPTLIEAVTYRLGAHTTADDPRRYRSDEEAEEWRARDPMGRFRCYLDARNILDDAAHQALDEDVAREVSAAVTRSELFEPDVAEPFRHCCADMPDELSAQLREFRSYDQSATEEWGAS